VNEEGPEMQTACGKIFFRILLISLYFCFSSAIMGTAFLGGLEKAPTFLVPIINPPFADTARTSPPISKISTGLVSGSSHSRRWLETAVLRRSFESRRTP
jgi:hypothetical protein